MKDLDPDTPIKADKEMKEDAWKEELKKKQLEVYFY
jgi:hypothetical protein